MHPSKGNSSHHDPSTDKSTSSEPKLVQPLGTLAQLERKIHTFQPIIKPSSSSSSKKQTGSDPGGPNSSGGSQQQHHQHFTQYLPHLLQPYSGRPPQPHMMDSGVIRLINPGRYQSAHITHKIGKVKKIMMTVFMLIFRNTTFFNWSSPSRRRSWGSIYSCPSAFSLFTFPPTTRSNFAFQISLKLKSWSTY